jgi:hypothetical protein
MPVQILIDQPGSGAPPGSVGVAREDLVVGFGVTLTAVGGPFLAYQWSIIDKAVDIVAGVQSAALVGAPFAPATPMSPIDIEGTYLVQVVVDSGSGLGANPDDVSRLTFYAGPTLNALATNPAELPRREMAFRETTEHNVPDLVFPLGNARGWAEERQRWQEVLKRIYLGKSWAWGRVAVPPGGPASLTGLALNCGVVWVAPGVVDVTFTTALPNANYDVVSSARGAGGQTYVDTETPTGFRLYRADPWGVLTDADFNFDVKARP